MWLRNSSLRLLLVSLAGLTVLLAADSPTADSLIEAKRPPDLSVQWRPLLEQALLFSVIEHGFRLATEPGTRTGLGGPFWKGYGSSVANLRGWADGDPFYVNYVGHPMQGAVASFLFVRNDPRHRAAEFGRSADYWRGRLRSMAFSFAYSAQFEIGPFSEASIGKIQSSLPQVGLVDHVITPTVGLGWMVTEDIVDRFIVSWFERRTENPWVLMAIRGGLNPARSMANMVGGKVPWHRDVRAAGVFRDRIAPRLAVQPQPAAENGTRPPGFGVAQFEFTFAQQTYFFPRAQDRACIGGGGVAAFRLSPSWEWIGDVSGCKVMENMPFQNRDVLTFLTGPRLTPAPAKRWSPHFHLLAGGTKTGLETIDMTRKRSLEALPAKASDSPRREEYTTVQAKYGFTMAAGGGLDVRVHRALALRLANLQFRQAWMERGDAPDLNRGWQFSTGVVLRMGNW